MAKPIDILSRQEIEDLIRSCVRRGRAPSGLRNGALLAVLWRCGLRIAEALALMPKDLDIETGVLRVHNGKGSKPRTLAIDAVGMAYLERWLDRRKALGLGRKKSAPIFCTLNGGPISDAYVRAMLLRKRAQLGMDKRVHPHAFRHSFASELAREGVPMPTIQAVLGHASLAVTNAYLAHVQPQDVIETLRARS